MYGVPCKQAANKDIGFGVYICSATSPFQRNDNELAKLRTDVASVVSTYYPNYAAVYQKIGGWNSMNAD